VSTNLGTSSTSDSPVKPSISFARTLLWLTWPELPSPVLAAASIGWPLAADSSQSASSPLHAKQQRHSHTCAKLCRVFATTIWRLHAEHDATDVRGCESGLRGPVPAGFLVQVRTGNGMNPCHLTCLRWRSTPQAVLSAQQAVRERLSGELFSRRGRLQQS
jgi:hypothetical protein